MVQDHCAEEAAASSSGTAADCHLTDWNSSAMLAAVRLLWSWPFSALICLANAVSISLNPSEWGSHRLRPNGTGSAQCTEVMAEIRLSGSVGLPAALSTGCLPYDSGACCHCSVFTLSADSLSCISKDAV